MIPLLVLAGAGLLYAGGAQEADPVEPITIDWELDYLQSYADIQRYRYRDSFEFRHD